MEKVWDRGGWVSLKAPVTYILEFEGSQDYSEICLKANILRKAHLPQASLECVPWLR